MKVRLESQSRYLVMAKAGVCDVSPRINRRAEPLLSLTHNLSTPQCTARSGTPSVTCILSILLRFRNDGVPSPRP